MENQIILVDFSQDDQKPWIRECVLLRQSKKAVLLRYETENGDRDQWFLTEQVEMIEQVGILKFETKFGFIGKWVKQYI